MGRTGVDDDQAAQFSGDPDLFQRLDDSNMALVHIVVFLSRDWEGYSLRQNFRLQAQPKTLGLSL